MSQALLLVLHFLGEPTATEKMAITSYERSRQTKVELKKAPSAGSVTSLPSTTYPTYDAELALRLEAELDAARTAAASLDEHRALEILSGVEAELRLHPALPQSAWLMAERWRVAERVGDLSESERARLASRAEALEGRRAVEFGAPAAPATEPSSVRAAVEGLSPRDRLELDGAPVGRDVSTLAGEHHVRVFRGERLLFAGWVTLR